jgi:WS/DGAT/MGAT family acyltransferase
MVSTPLDHNRPLWQLHLVERYGKGCVFVLRIHHCMADGVSLVQIFDALMDPPAGEKRAAPHTNGVHGVIDNAFDAIGAAIRSTEHLVHEGWELVSHPERVLGVIGGGAAVLGKLALMGPDAPSIFRGKLGTIKRTAWSSSVPLSDIKAVGKALGGTVNDVILVGVAGALRRYMAERGAPANERGLRAMVPVNLLPPGAKSDGGNHFGLVFVTVPVGVLDPVERMERIRAEMARIKSSPEAYIGYGVVGMLGVMPAEIEHAALDALCSMASMVITNVPGARVAHTLTGKTVRRAMFWVPEAAGLGLGLSILSYADTVQLGVLADASLVPDPESLANAFSAECAELVELVRAVA